MGILSRDTTHEAEQVQLGILRRQGPIGRLQLLQQAVLEGWALTRLGPSGAIERWLGQRRPERLREELLPIQPLATPLLVCQTLEKLGILYVIGGSYASSVHGEPRFTRDCDILAAIKPQHVDLLVDQLGAEFYLSKTAMTEALKRCTSFSLIHLQTGFKVDLFVAHPRAFDQERLRRGLRLEIGQGIQVRFSTAEDTILAKLEWYTLSPSERQWRDILGILMLQQDRLDPGYLRFWARELEVTELLEKAQAEVSQG